MRIVDNKKPGFITLIHEIPVSKNPTIFGPPTWAALHETVENIPCDGCKDEAISYMNFFHDLKNYELNKKIMYRENFLYWINRIASMKNKTIIMK